MDMAVHVLHAVKTAWEPDQPDTVRDRLDQKGAKKFGDEYDESLQLEHGGMVALSGCSEKAGKASDRAYASGSAKFSRLSNSQLPGYTIPAMKDPLITIRNLYPDMDEQGLQAAEAKLRRYLEIIARIHSRVKAERKGIPGFTGDSGT